MKPAHSFSRFAHHATDKIGRPYAFVFALVIIVAWLLSGRYFAYSEVWRATIETAFTIVTFLMVMLLQHSQNHNTKAIQMKLDELIHSQIRAKNDFMEIEKLTEAEVESIREEHHETASKVIHKKP